jgi:hypothetical protein
MDTAGQGHPGLAARLKYRTALKIDSVGPSMYMPSMLSRPRYPVEPPALDACVAASPNGRNFNNSARVARTPHSTNQGCLLIRYMRVRLVLFSRLVGRLQNQEISIKLIKIKIKINFN